LSFLSTTAGVRNRPALVLRPDVLADIFVTRHALILVVIDCLPETEKSAQELRRENQISSTDVGSCGRFTCD
jgi:hypothetical protein